MEQILRKSGTVGIANASLSCEAALKIGRAAAFVLHKENRRPVFVIGADTRVSSDMLVSALSAGLCSAGADVKCIKAAPTAAVSYLVNRFSADAGIMVTAENSSYEYNGIKLFSDGGFAVTDENFDKIKKYAAAGVDANGQNIGNIYFESTAIDLYVHHLLSSVHVYLDGLKIAVDCANGSASSTAKILFSSLCTDSFILFNNPNGVNINKYCGTAHMKHLATYVRSNGLDAGIAFNGDASSCLMVDENGSIVDGDMILAMCALDFKERGLLEQNTVVGTVMSNLGFRSFCKEHHINFVEADIGLCSVLQKMSETGCILGGEQSGKLVFGNNALTADGQLTAIQVLSLMKRKNKKLSELAGIMYKYPQIEINVPVCEATDKALYANEKIDEAIKEGRILLGENGRLVVRPSETENVVYVMTEGEDIGLISTLADDIAAVIAQELA